MLYIALNLREITRSRLVLILVILFKQRVITIELTFNSVCNLIFKIKSKVKKPNSCLILLTLEHIFQPVSVRTRARSKQLCFVS